MLAQRVAIVGAAVSIVSWSMVNGSAAMQPVTPAGVGRAQSAEARTRAALERDLSVVGLRFGAPVFMRIFKQERALELWVEAADARFVLFRSYPICAYSGAPGPKLRQGDNQAPEGFYQVGAAQLNPHSRYHLALNLGYPNAYDRAHARTGDFLMVHGDCVSIGCYAMGDAAIEEIYTLAAAALAGGQRAFDVHAFPFRPDAATLDAQRASPWHAFWNELEPAWAAFERSHKPPRIRVVGKRYIVGES